MAWGPDQLLNPTYIADIHGSDVLAVHAFVCEIKREHIEAFKGDIVAGIPKPNDGSLYAIGAGWRFHVNQATFPPTGYFRRVETEVTVKAAWSMSRSLMLSAFDPQPKLSPGDLQHVLREAWGR